MDLDRLQLKPKSPTPQLYMQKNIYHEAHEEKNAYLNIFFVCFVVKSIPKIYSSAAII